MMYDDDDDTRTHRRTTTSTKCFNVSILYHRAQYIYNIYAFRFYYCVINTYFGWRRKWHVRCTLYTIHDTRCMVAMMIYTRNKPLVTRFVLSSVRPSNHFISFHVSAVAAIHPRSHQNCASPYNGHQPKKKTASSNEAIAILLELKKLTKM